METLWWEKKKNTKPINRKWSQQNKRGKWAEERNTPELEITKTRKHKLPNWFSATMSSPTGSSYCKQNLLYRGETSQQGTQHNPWYRHWKTTLVTTRTKTSPVWKMFKSSNQTSARSATTCDDIGRKLIQPILCSGGRALQTSIATIDLFHTPTIPNIKKFNKNSKRKFKPIIPNSANNCR